MRTPVSAWHLLIGVVSIYVALVFNSAAAIRRFSAQQASYDNALGLVGLELLLVLFFTAALFYLASLAGRVIFKGVLVIVLVLSAVSAYYMSFFNVVIGYGVVQATLTTDIDLSKEVVGAGVIAFVAVLGVLPTVWVLRTGLAAGELGGRLLMLVLCVLACAIVVFIHPFLLKNSAGKTGPKSASPLGVVVHSYVPANWVAGLAMSAANAYENVARRQSLENPADKFKYRPSTDLDGTYLVLVIGESARYDRMRILGHSRENTPELTRMPNLVAMQATSCNTSTKLSLQCMFVRSEAVDDGGGTGRQSVSEDMVFAVLKRLGFTSELFALQGEVWFYNSVNANYYEHREIIYAKEKNIGKPIDDLALVSELEESVARYPRGKHLIVLHTKGSHHLYTHRYPRSYAWYTPECLSADVPCPREELLNSYDNSIAYTDHFLSQVIKRFESRKALVIYTSDHGESIGEGTHLHGTPKHMAPPEQRRVPLMIWASKSFLSNPRNARSFAGLQARKHKMASHEHIFDSMLGCLGIESEKGGIDQGRNLCHNN